MPTFAEQIAEIERWCESPIEKAMLVPLVHAILGYPADVLVKAPRCRGFQITWDPPEPVPVVDQAVIVVQPQPLLDHRRPDFAIMFCSASGRFAAAFVECDGHDFHERTKEQAQRDRRYDRDAQREGWLSLRFTGREINEDARECAIEAWDVLLERVGS